ncbi:MAG: hypothetical protein ACKOD2_15530 [Ilumatobacteraceae bacterium]
MRGLRPLTTGLWSASALLVGHQLTYWAVYPDSEQRAAVLHHTGHGWTHALWPAVALFVVSAVVATTLDARGDRRGRSGAFAVHASAQVMTYLAIELTERGLHAGSWSGLRCEVMSHHTWIVLVAGAAIQLLCAVGAALLARVVERLARCRREPEIARPARVDLVGDRFAPLLVPVDLRPRGPPAFGFPLAALTNARCR